MEHYSVHSDTELLTIQTFWGWHFKMFISGWRTVWTFSSCSIKFIFQEHLCVSRVLLVLLPSAYSLHISPALTSDSLTVWCSRDSLSPCSQDSLCCVSMEPWCQSHLRVNEGCGAAVSLCCCCCCCWSSDFSLLSLLSSCDFHTKSHRNEITFLHLMLSVWRVASFLSCL